MNDHDIHEHLLVVEDDHSLREEIERVLKRRTSYQITVAADGEEALQKADEQRFDLLITDVRMPGMDGIDLLEALKEKQPDIASIIITAFADEQATIRALRLGANDYIRKPFSIADLVNAIERQITVQRLRTEAMQNRRMMEGLVASMNTGVLAVDGNGSISAMNRKTEELLSLNSQDCMGRALTAVFAQPPKEHEQVILSLMNELQTRGVETLERDLQLKQSGLAFSYRLSATRVSSTAGEHLGAVVLFNDVSDVVQAQKLNAWKDLARTVAHEIKNPLTPIKLSAQQLKTARNQPDERFWKLFDDAIRNIMKNADRLDTLAREFSRFGRLPRAELVPLKLTDAVREAIADYQFPPGITLNTELGDVPDIQGDHESLLRMLTNLLNNAVEAMPGGGSLTVSCRADDQSSVILRVADSGEGIDPEVRDTLFKPYVTSKAGGTGLGLVVVREVVSRHDADIHLESERGQGTSFEIRFPALTTSKEQGAL